MKKLLAMLLALMMVLSVMTVAVFAEAADGANDPDAAGDDMSAGETETPEKNPETGLALAALPVIFSAAAVAVSKKH